jgi:RNA polymerase sigma-70 factor, ECF subfamily
VPQVYGYVLRRCGSVPLAEDLTAEVFMAAVDAVRRANPPKVTVAWLITVARNKLVDHWRRAARQERAFELLDGLLDDIVDDWDTHLDAAVAQDTLARLGAHHRSALTLRYLDGLPVAEVAAHLGRTIGATEVLLVRAKRAFRAAYDAADADGEEGRR